MRGLLGTRVHKIDDYKLHCLSQDMLGDIVNLRSAVSHAVFLLFTGAAHPVRLSLSTLNHEYYDIAKSLHVLFVKTISVYSISFRDSVSKINPPKKLFQISNFEQKMSHEELQQLLKQPLKPTQIVRSQAIANRYI